MSLILVWKTKTTEPKGVFDFVFDKTKENIHPQMIRGKSLLSVYDEIIDCIRIQWTMTILNRIYCQRARGVYSLCNIHVRYAHTKYVGHRAQIDSWGADKNIKRLSSSSGKENQLQINFSKGKKRRCGRWRSIDDVNIYCLFLSFVDILIIIFFHYYVRVLQSSASLYKSDESMYTRINSSFIYVILLS